MNCTEASKLIDAYIDGELDLVNSLEVEQHLHNCAGCARVYQNRMALRAGLRDDALYRRPSAAQRVALRQRLQSSLRAAGQAGSPPRVKPWQWLGALAALAAVTVVVLVFGLARGGLFAAPAGDALIQEVVASHVRSQITDHLMDVASSDQHTVKPWFNGKLNYSPPVVDLSSQGYPLAGGRLDYLDNRPVAALVYRHNQHVIDVFVWPAENGASTPASFETRQGYNLARWTQAGMNFWAVSDVSPAEFGDFVKLLQAAQ